MTQPRRFRQATAWQRRYRQQATMELLDKIRLRLGDDGLASCDQSNPGLQITAKLLDKCIPGLPQLERVRKLEYRRRSQR